jgi:hypothetical protein
MPFSLEDKDGRPWTASTPLGWIVLIVVVSSGIAAVALGLYLSLWVWSKRRSALPLYGFGLSLLLAVVLVAVPHSFVPGMVDFLSGLDPLVWIASTFLLRHEIKRYYKEAEDWNIEIGPFFTFFFSVVYINYCLNPVMFSERESMTSLNLRK